MAGLRLRTRPPALVRYARILTVAIVIGIGIGELYWAATAWHLTDANAYWQAALRIRNGEQLYPALASTEASEVFRYAPWFAWLAVPFTFLPQALAGAVWSGILIMASSAAMIPLARRGAWLAVAFFWPVLIGISAIGNAQPLIVAALMLGVERRSGPLWIALAASMKAFPILFVAVYVGRRAWWRATATIVIAAMLVAPMLLYDLSNYTTSAGQAALLLAWPVVYAFTISILLAATVLLARTKWSWLTAATTVALALPRFFVYDVTFLAVGTVSRPEPKRVQVRPTPASAHPVSAANLPGVEDGL